MSAFDVARTATHQALDSPRTRLCSIRFAEKDWELSSARRIRREVFVSEQGIFSDDDKDRFDAVALNLIAVFPCVEINPTTLQAGNTAAEEVMGTVRIHGGRFPDKAVPSSSHERVWWGSRLAVAAERRGFVTAATGLIRTAVASAVALGCDRFFAHIQPANRRLFKRVGWREIELVEFENRSHWLVEADLSQFDPSQVLNDELINQIRKLTGSPLSKSPALSHLSSDLCSMEVATSAST
ncbi:MAG: MSMEG_0567/Sll0786 family nitrogen starvation N-acetyltransferase [Planctomycetota bacterium]